MKKNLEIITITGAICCLIVLLTIINSHNYNRINVNVENLPVFNVAAITPQNDEFIYLSDIDYIANLSKPGWGTILKDTTSAGTKISVKIEGAYYSFDKGMWAHAASTLVYDLNNYNYDYFTAYVGLNNTAAASSNGVKFYVYTSMDGTNWNLQTPENPTVLKAGSEAEFLKVNIKGVRYLKLYADSNGSNGNDHSVYADAKLIKEGYKEAGEELVPDISELDNKIKEYININANLTANKEYELTLLKRELISRVGNYAMKKFLGDNAENRALYEWLTSDVNILRLYVLGGKPDGGSYFNSLAILADLYAEYSDDFKNTTLLINPTTPSMTYGDLYKKMAMSIALTHSTRVGLWMNSSIVENQSEPLRRYAIFKYMHKTGGMRISATMDMTHTFEDLQVQEMRLVLYNNIDDEEILWLNRYVQDNVDSNPGNVWRYTTPHPYIAYVWPNYANPVYYASENVDYFNELFAINKTENNKGVELTNANGLKTGKIGLFDSEFVIPGGKTVPEYRLKITRGTEDNKVYKVWMNFRNKFGTGCVCGGISKSGANIRGTHGIPAMVVGQPGHAALMFYTKDANGRGYWRLDNDVSGWTLSGGGGRLLGWGNSNTDGYSNGVYIELEQAAVNDYANLIKAEEQIMLANVYNSELLAENIEATEKQAILEKQEELYRNAITIQSINFDAWIGLINVYGLNENKTENDYYNLAEEMATNLKYYPLPMYNATNLIKPKLTSVDNIYKFTLLQTRTLTEASALPNNTETSFTVMQPGVTRLEANFLLGKIDKTIANFSFDGDNAGKIVLSDRFNGNGVRWDYSLDGKESWTEVSFSAEEEHKLQLTPEEIASITADNDIYVHIVGVNYEEKNLYKIDIVEQSLPTTLYGNDLENRVIGVNLNYEWRNSETDEWTSYATASPNNTGDKTLQVRLKATGTKLASDIETFTFTADNQTDKRKYVPISHLSVTAYSTQSKDSKRPYYAPNAIDGNIHTLWHTDFAINVLQQPENPFITIKLDKPRYISALEFVQTKYKANDPDNIKNARVYVSEDGENWILSGQIENCSNPYTSSDIRTINFTESVYGSYIKMEFDTYDMFASLALVNVFQDMTINPRPTAGIAYSTTTPTQENVVARLVNVSADNYEILSEGGDTHTFTENGEFTFRFIDKDTNVEGSATAVVDWIDRKAPSADVTYSTTLPTKEEVVATLTNISENVYIIDTNNKTTEYIEVSNNKVKSITYFDNEGNIIKVAHVDDDMQATKIEYYNDGDIVYVTDLNKLGVITKETFYDNEGNIINPSNKDEYRNKYNLASRSNPLENTFADNGTYTFRIRDIAGNITSIEATVDNIDTIAPVATVEYNITTTTNKEVTATLIDASETIIITNNNGSNTYTFTKNGEFTFEYQDEAGNVGYTKAIVTWIKKNEQPTPDEPIITPPHPDDPIITPPTPDNPSKPDSPNEGNNNNNQNNGNNNNSGSNNSNGGINNSGSNNNYQIPNGNNMNNQNNQTNNDNNYNLNDYDYKEFHDLNVVVGIKGLASELQNVHGVKVNKYLPTTKYQKLIGNEGIIYELTFLGSNNKKVSISKSEITLTINLDPNKEFIGVYILRDSILKELNYEKINTNTIKVKSDSLGEYVVKYKETKKAQKEETTEKFRVEHYENAWYLAVGALIILVMSLILAFRRD